MKVTLRFSSGILTCLLAGCGPTFMGAPPPMQPQPAYPTPLQAHPPTLQPAVPPEGPTATNLQQVPDVAADDVYLPPRSSTASTYHRVVPGDTVAGLAKRFGVTVEQLRKANAWSANAELKVGDLVQIPK